MEKIFFFSGLAALSGGITGLLAFFSAYGIKNGQFYPAAAAMVVLGFSIISAALMLIVFKLYSRLSGSGFASVISGNWWIFGVPSLSILVIPFYIKYYGQLSTINPDVFGNIYIPFYGYLRVSMASFFLITAAGALWLAVFFILATKFMKVFYDTAEGKPVKKSALEIFWFAFVFYAATTSFVTFVYPPTGDEPHYLVIARSIAADLDVNLENNYERKDYEKFYPVELDYRGLHNITGKDGKGVYTTHDIGLPLLMAPFVKTGGRYLPQFFMNFMAALLCAVLYLMLIRFGIASKYASISAMGASIFMPLAAGASLILTEIPAALLLAYCVYVLSGGGEGKRNLLFFSAAAFMPWLHLKLIIFPVVIYLCYYYLVFKNRKFDLKTEIINNMPVLVSAALYVWFYYAVYGIIAPFGVKELHESVFAEDPSTQMNKFVVTPSHVFVSVIAVLFDRDYGLIPYCISYVFTLWGLMLAAMKKQFVFLIPLLLCLPYLLLFLLWKDWTGSMTPARQLMPVVPVLVLFGAYFLQSADMARTRIFKAFAVLSLFASWLLMAVPPLRYASSKDKIYAFMTGHAPQWILWIVPPFRENLPAALVMSAIYIIITGVLFNIYTLKNKITKQL